MRSLPISMQTGLEESERAFDEVLALLHLDRKQLEQKAQRIRSKSSASLHGMNRRSTRKEMRYV